jgi:ZIP family zinc transporter
MKSNIPSLLNVLLYAAFPVVAATAGGSIAAVKPPGPRLRSILQHFAAGVVFSVVAVELLPDIVKRHLPWEVALGFGAGVALMLVLKKVTGASASSAGLIVGVGADLFIDGLLIGIGFSAGEKAGKLLAFAITVELCSLGMALAATLMKASWSRSRTILTVSGISFLTMVGAMLGATLLRAMSSELMEVTLAFGLAALLFLVTEELLVEAHEEPETPTGTAMFFVGFLLFLIIGMVS